MPLAKKGNTTYTYQDYLQWPDDERWEIINGRAWSMTPAPAPRHQTIISNLLVVLKNSPKNQCYTGLAPTDVVLDDENVVQPDLFLVCDRSKIQPKNIQGTPDLVIEVTSPSTEKKDRAEKRQLYEKHGVREYLIVHTEAEYVEYYLLLQQRYGQETIINWDERVTLASGIVIKLWEIFEKET